MTVILARHHRPGQRIPAGKVARVRARRVMVYGVTGSGKTTLTHQLADLMGVRAISVDDEIGWLPGWVMRSDAEQRRLAAAFVAKDAWVIDTAYQSFIDVVMPRVEAIVALDYPRWLSLGRLVRRSAMRAIDKAPICNGNTESFRQMFSRDSIVAWHFASFARKRARIRAWHADPSMPRVIVLRSPRQTRRFLDAVSAGRWGYRRVDD